MKVLGLLFLITLPLLASGAGLDDPWTYSYEDQASWPTICLEGQLQSPIDIVTEEAVVDLCGSVISGPLVFDGNNEVELNAVNDGYSLKWSVADSKPAPTLAGGPLKSEYTFVQFHLHWVAEHSIDGHKHPLEIHLLHRRSDLTVTEALEVEDGMAVIVVMGEIYKKSEENKFALSEIMPVVPQLMTKGSNTSMPIHVVDLNHLLSAAPQSYFTYKGSLTTPGCQEVVTWIIMDTPIKIADTQFATIHKTNVGGSENWRLLQATNNRTVYHSKV